MSVSTLSILRHAPFWCRMRNTPLRRDAPGREVFEDTHHLSRVIGMDERQHVRAQQLRRVVPQDLAHRRADEHELTALVEPERDVGGAVHQLSEPVLRLTQPLVGLTLLAFANADEQRTERAERPEAKLSDPVGERGEPDGDGAEAGGVAHERDQPHGGEPLPSSDLAELGGFVGKVVDDEDHRLVEVVDELRQPATTSGRILGKIRRHPGRLPHVGDGEVVAVVGHEHDPAPTADEVGGALQRVLDGRVDVEIRRRDDQAAEVGHVLFRVAATDVHRRVAQQHEHLVEPTAGESALTVRTVAARRVLRFPDVVHDGARVERALHVLDHPHRDLRTEQIADALRGPSGAGPSRVRLAIGRRRAGVEQGSVPGHVQEDVGGHVDEVVGRASGGVGSARARRSASTTAPPYENPHQLPNQPIEERTLPVAVGRTRGGLKPEPVLPGLRRARHAGARDAGSGHR